MSSIDPTYLDLCDFLAVHPCCGAELGDCRCDEDAELEADATSHPAGCICHAECEQ